MTSNLFLTWQMSDIKLQVTPFCLVSAGGKVRGHAHAGSLGDHSAAEGHGWLMPPSQTEVTRVVGVGQGDIWASFPLDRSEDFSTS